MNDLESAIHWRPWSVFIVLALFIAVFSLIQFNLLQWSFSLELGCLALFLSAGWNIHILVRMRVGKRPGMHGQVADGLLITGLLMVFIGAFL